MLPLGDVEHGNINRLARGLAEGFSAIGMQPHFIDYRQDAPPPWPELEALIGSGDVRTLVAMNGVGFLSAGHEKLADAGIDMFVYGTDHPCHLYPLMEAAPPHTIISFPTASNLDFARRRMRTDIRYVHVPHATQVRVPRPWAERDIAVLMVGNLRQRAADCAAVWQTRGAEIPILEAMRDIHLSTPPATLEGLGEQALEATGNSHSDLAQDRAFAKILRYFDPFARAQLREQVISALAGVAVTIVGDWQGLGGGASDCHIFTGPKDADTVSDLIGRAKIVINTVPAYYRSHERIFEAMAAGAVTVTTGPTDFPDLNEANGVLSVADPAALGQTVAELLADDGALRRRGEAATVQCSDNHGWTDRAGIIKDALTEH